MLNIRFFRLSVYSADNTPGNHGNCAWLHQCVPQTEHSYNGDHDNLYTPTYTDLGSNVCLHSEGLVTNCKEPWYSFSKDKAEDTYRLVLS